MSDSTDKETLEKIFSRYNLGTLKDGYQEIKGDVDLNYKITTTTGTYLLKHIQIKENISQFEMVGNLYTYLREKEASVPRVYKTQSGNYVENDFILYEFIEGETKKDWSEQEIISLVSNFAKMLIALKEYPVPDFIKNKNDKYIQGANIQYCHDVFRPKILDLSTAEEIKNSIIKTIDLLYGKLSDFEALPKFLIHGDLNEMNAIFKDGINVGIIDFGISYDPIVYDLGEFCYWFAMPWWTEDLNVKRYNLIIETFEKILPLSKLEKELLPYMMLRRGMMDLMLTLDWYWSNEGVAVPENRLNLLINRNDKIVNLIQ